MTLIVHQCDHMARIFFKFGHLQECKFAQQHKIFAKVGWKFCQIANKAFKSCPNTFKILAKWRNLAKSGHTVVVDQHALISRQHDSGLGERPTARQQRPRPIVEPKNI